jgi:fructose-like PTS system EIIB component
VSVVRILAVTSCPLGLVYTHLAKEALLKAADKLGIDIKVETQGEIQSDIIGEEDIKEAIAVILTNDMPIGNIERFEGLPKIYISCKDIINNSEDIIKKII